MTFKDTNKGPDRWARSKDHQPLPADVGSEIDAGSGPCQATDKYGTLQTNQLGELQAHPCSCGSVFIYSATYGWLYIDRKSQLRERIRELVKQGVAEGAFKPNARY